MDRRKVFVLAVLIAAVAAVAALAETPFPAPAELTATAPDTFKVLLSTSKGDVVIEVHRAWAPNGADRFYNLVKNDFYSGARFFRVIPGFMAQIGIHANPKVTDTWKNATILDDPVVESNKAGYVTFAMRGQPHTRSTQFFINFGNNSNLDRMGFAPFGKVVEGMDIVDSLYGGYGEGAPRGRGPDQMRVMSEGNEYLLAEFGKLDYIREASVK